MRIVLAVMVLGMLAACSGEVPHDTNSNPECGTCEECATGNGTEVGQKLGDIELTSCAGDKVALSTELCAKKLALIYIASGWCTPCREKMPTIQKWYETYGPDGLEVYLILPEDNGADPATKTFCQEWKDDYQLSFNTTIDPTKAVSGPFLTGGGQYPVILLVDDEWNILFKETGSNNAELETYIQTFLAL
jgi:thiol-disulfide isomerase/thioredoxin